MPSQPRAAVAARIESLAPALVALTGCGAESLAGTLTRPSRVLDEFQCLVRGARELLGDQRPMGGGGPQSTQRILVVSLGTGTSVVLSAGGAATRIGGTSTGGGTLDGLARLLVAPQSFGELCALAARGERGRVDLMLSDLFAQADPATSRHFAASCFAKAGRADEPPERADLAAALMGLVADNVALISVALAAGHDVAQIVYCGSTLRENPALETGLEALTRAWGREAVVLRGGEFAGAIGARASLHPDPQRDR